MDDERFRVAFTSDSVQQGHEAAPARLPVLTFFGNSTKHLVHNRLALHLYIASGIITKELSATPHDRLLLKPGDPFFVTKSDSNALSQPSVSETPSPRTLNRPGATVEPTPPIQAWLASTSSPTLIPRSLECPGEADAIHARRASTPSPTPIPRSLECPGEGNGAAPRALFCPGEENEGPPCSVPPPI